MCKGHEEDTHVTSRDLEEVWCGSSAILERTVAEMSLREAD